MAAQSIYPLPPRRSTLRVLQTLFTILASSSLALGSLPLSLIWLGINVRIPLLFSITISPEYALEGKILTTLILMPLMLLAFGLFGTVAMLMAKRWLDAVLTLPVSIVSIILLYALVVFAFAHLPGIIFVLVLILLNVCVIWFSWLSLRSAPR